MAENLPMLDEAIKVTRLPEIIERLQEISTQAQRRVDEALALEVSDETLKTAKAARSSLNKDFEILETKRKEAKNLILKPYVEFEDIYKPMITDVFNAGISTLNNRIGAVETQLKRQKKQPKMLLKR